jgi:Kef-type K+ transport system membrane component KefB
LVYGIPEATTKGSASATVVAALGLAAFLLVAFAIAEIRSAQPLVHFAIFRQRSLTVANIIMATLGVALTSTACHWHPNRGGLRPPPTGPLDHSRRGRAHRS